VCVDTVFSWFSSPDLTTIPSSQNRGSHIRNAPIHDIRIYQTPRPLSVVLRPQL
jgi:hypothetical protein